MHDHEFYEELSALAAIGELSSEEMEELDGHLNDCEQCRATAAEFTHIVHAELPSMHSDSVAWMDRLVNFFAWGDVESRFREQANIAGYRFSPEVDKGTRIAQLMPAPRGMRAAISSSLLALVVITVATIEYRKNHGNYFPNAEAPARGTAYSTGLPRLDSQIKGDTATIEALEFQLGQMQSELKRNLEQMGAAAQQHQKLEVENRDLQAAFDEVREKAMILDAQAMASDKRYADLNETTQRIESDRVADGLVIASQQRQLEDLNAQLNAQAAVLGEEQQLLSAGRDVRDMMGARNLHIIDVFDTDVNGSRRRAFGRVFYSEGKSLVFYAFDLAGGNLAAPKHSFQAWGLRDGADESAKSLGIFYVDDVAQKRWVLKVENAKVLEQIDSVFVTVEPFGGAEKPSARKLLYAFLRNQPNHP